MSRASGEQNRRKRTPSLPALLAKGDVRKYVQAGLLPTTIYRASEPTFEFSGLYYKSETQKLKEAGRYADWIRRGSPRCASSLPKMMRLVPRRVKSARRIDVLMRVQRGSCYLCGAPMRATDAVTMDHVVPKAKGGRDRGNVLATHYDCNQAKADRDPFPCELLYLEGANLIRLNLPLAEPSVEGPYPNPTPPSP